MPQSGLRCKVLVANHAIVHSSQVRVNELYVNYPFVVIYMQHASLVIVIGKLKETV